LDLTTPNLINDYSVFPGANWFLYWKTSVSLWKSKLSESQLGSKVYVPINWAIHTENNDQFDFGNYRPETNLFKLSKICEELDIELIFMLNCCPVPFIQNGGIPAILAKHFSKHQNGDNLVTINHDGELIKMFSFFDTRIFQGYSKFLRRLGQYFIDMNIKNSILGIEYYFHENYRLKSYFEDSSVIFEKTFEQYLSSLDDLQNQSEILLKDRFFNMIRDIYKKEAEKYLLTNWAGNSKISVLGGSQQDFFKNINDNQQSNQIIGKMISSFSFNAVPSLCLLQSATPFMNEVSQELLTNNVLYHLTEESDSPFLENEQFHFVPYSIFSIYEEDVFFHSDYSWSSLGLLSYIQDQWGSSYKYEMSNSFFYDESCFESDKIYFFHGANINLKKFYEWLKILMNGGQIILDKSEMPLEILKRLESFILENKLKVEKINLELAIHHIKLGEGSMTIIDGQALKKFNAKTRNSFWHKIINTFTIKSIQLNSTDHDLNYAWFTRGTRPGELGYEEVRRVHIYNATSYVKKVEISVSTYFSLLKVVNKVNAVLETKPKNIKITMQPQGKLLLDFGVFS